MNPGRILLVAVRALTRNKMRSSLTVLGIIIGVGAVIAMVGIGEGASHLVQAQISSLGDNLLTVFPGSENRGGFHGGAGTSSTLTPADAEAIALQVPELIAVSPVTQTFAPVGDRPLAV